jgi:hypothetical protein
MILYVNGDSHTAAGEAVNDYCFAEDDPKLWAYGRAPHPDNLAVSWGQKLADRLCATLHCDAESASSNSRILRTTYEYLKHHTPDLIMIGWTTWEREEWWHGPSNRYWQINAGGTGKDWPEDIKSRYKNWIVSLDQKTWVKCHRHWYQEIHKLHVELDTLGIKHLFFNCWHPKDNLFLEKLPSLDWADCYPGATDKNLTYVKWCQDTGFTPTKPGRYHFGADAHAAWAEFLYTKIVESCLLKNELF